MYTPRRPLVITLVLCLAWPHSLLAARAEGPLQPEDPEYARLITHLQDQVDRTLLDPEEALDRLDYDPQEILAFVRDRIRFEQYPGTLRGALGTLMSRAGNALDQALLSATLLRDAGLDARIVRGRLDPGGARRLLGQMRQAAPADGLDLAAVEQLLKDTEHPDVRTWLDPAGPPATTRELVDSVAAAIGRAAPAGRSPGARVDELVEEARDYFWVEYRDAAAQPWTGFHPAFPDDASAGLVPEAVAYFADSIPETLQHRFRVRVFVETLIGEVLDSRQLTPDWERPVANMAGRAFSVSNQVIDLPVAADATDFAATFSTDLAQASMFAPMVSGQILPGTLGFDLDGVVFDMEAIGMASMGQGELFRTVGGKTDSAAAAISGLGNAQARKRLRYLTAQWIEYSLISPGGEERSFRRYLYDAIGPATRESGDLRGVALERAQAWALLGSENYVVESGRLPADQVLLEYSRWMEVLAELAPLRARKGELSLSDYHRAQARLQGPEGLRLFSLLRHFDAALAGDRDLTYRSAPTLVALHMSPVAADRVRLSTDIMSNERRSRLWDQPDLARALVIRRGVWETYAERFGLENWQRDEVLLSPFPELVGDPQTRLVPLASAGGELSGSFADARTLMREDSRYGQVLRIASQAGEPPAWWRVDERSGAVIGVLGDGRGAVAIEYKILAILAVAFVAAVVYRGISRCSKLLMAEAALCIGSPINAITGNMSQPYVDAYASQCFWEQAPPWSDDGEPRCRCGGIGEPACPDWQTP